MTQTLVVIAASRGGLSVLKTLVSDLDRDFQATILVVMHVGRHPSILPELLAAWGAVAVSHAIDGETMKIGRIYVAPPDRHMVVHGDKIQLLDTAAENFCRPAADPLFRSAAVHYGDRVIGVVLTGDLDDGAAGLAAIAARGGYRIVQQPEDCEAPSMPRSAIAAAGADVVTTQEKLPSVLRAAIGELFQRGGAMISSRPDLDREAQIAENGLAYPEDLDEIAERSALTCPSCNGVLWRLRDERPLRYRCHTGHAYSVLSLEEATARATTDAIWRAIRAVREQMILAQERCFSAQRLGNYGDAARERARVEENEKLVALLREVAGAHALVEHS